MHGKANCTQAENGVFCFLDCNEGYGFALRIPPFYFCAYDGLWQPAELMPFPDCSIKFFSNSILRIGTVSVLSNELNCKDNFFLGQLEKHMKRKISNKINRICKSKIVCEVENMIAECESRRDKTEEETNIIYRRKRNSRSLQVEGQGASMLESVSIHLNKSGENFEEDRMLVDSDVFDIEGLNTNTSSVEEPIEIGLHEQNAFRNTIELEFQLTGKLSNNSEEMSGEQLSLMHSIQVAIHSLADAANNGELDISLGSNKLQVESIKFDEEKSQFVCEAGTVAQGNICVKCPVGTYFNVVSETCKACPMGTYQFLEGQFSCLVCPEKTSTTAGQSKSVGECKAQCLPGTFSPTGLEPCETCQIGFYQSSYAQTECIFCPYPKTTHRRGVRNVLECKYACQPGEVSRIGLQPCFPCPDGYFQPHENSKSCFKCPESLKTGIQGAKNISTCQGITQDVMKKPLPKIAELSINDCFSVPCHHGATCKALDIGFLCICVLGYTGNYCEKEIDECQTHQCQNGGTCKDHINGYTCLCQAGYTGRNCEEDIDECLNNPCYNGAVCFDEINAFFCQCSAGFVGPLCQYNTDECLSNPCENGGYCQDLVADYTCDCMPGFQGRNCEINIDDCAGNPCKNNATCVDDILYFRCECPHGFRGTTCEINIDECIPEPCMNAATCIDGIAGFKCVCPPSYVGDLCETELDSNFLLRFPSSGTLDFVQVDYLPKPLSAVTLCMWMQTRDKVNYGTPISYAEDGGADNLLTLTDYSGFVFYVNMDKVVTDVTANDGMWHHICTTWSSVDGMWSFYKDGLKEDSGTGLAKGTVIPDSGALILGQEQDRRAAAFSTPESFIGTLTLLNIWDHVLSAETIASFSTRCDKYKGNVKSWADFRVGIKGKVELRESHFCSGCASPESPPLNGDVAVIGMKTQAVLNFICNTGYQMKGVPTRHCLSSGDWSDSTPQCVRVACGFPGHIANGYINGRQYFFQDVIQYVCNPGYKLNGASTHVCQANARWSEQIPHCDEILCEAPQLLENGKVLSVRIMYSFGDVIDLTCNEGYQLDGASSLSCSSHGLWNESLPVCQPKSCDSPPRVPHGQLNGTYENLAVGSVVSYKCDEGFRMKESGEIYCELNNRWAGAMARCDRISCSMPSQISHGSMDGTDLQFGGMVTYKCDQGYEMNGRGTSVCQANEMWSDPPPVCLPISCGSLEALDQGSVDVPKITYGSVAKYSCHIGYELQGVKSRKCRSTGEWSGDAPTCVPVSCSQPESISNGRYLGSDWTVGNTVTYTCNPGYLLIGEPERVCLESGNWLYKIPRCEPVECMMPDSIVHGSVKFDGRKFGQRLTYTCDAGYQLVGQAVRLCLEDQTWGSELPHCTPISCGSPNKIDNAVMLNPSSFYKSVVQYTCVDGFRLEGPQKRTCTADGKWSGRDPWCEVIRCPEPISVYHAYLINSDTRYGSIVEYYCDEGYKLQGPVQRFCNGSGQWAGPEPVCIQVKCGFPKSISNGDLFATESVFQALATYSCNPGYELEGPSSRICLQDASWSGIDPHCIAIRCSTSDMKIDNGRVIGDNDAAGATIQYECEVGYFLVGDTTRTCLTNKTWSGMAPSCFKVQCPIPVAPLNARIAWKGNSFEDVVIYSCVEGYTLSGQDLRSCLPNGSWSGVDPRCVPVQCEDPENPSNGKVLASWTTYGSYIEYKCNRGYQIKGFRKRRCTSSRSWSEKQPYCNQIFCINPPTIEFGHTKMKHEKYVVDAEVQYYCDEGFTLQPSEQPVVCNDHGKWNGQTPRCKIVACSTPPNPQFGYIVGNNFSYGNEVLFACNNGWKLIGERSLTCNSNGKWSASFPSCAGTLCPTPFRIENGFVSSSNFAYGSTIHYICYKGYVLQGVSEHKCLNNNTWSGYPPMCKPLACEPPHKISHALIMGDIFQYGSTVTYVCETGYELHGPRNLKCTENGTWSNEPPMCMQISCPLPDVLANGEVLVYSNSQGGVGRNAQISIQNDQRGDIAVDSRTILETSQQDIFHLGDEVTYRCFSGFNLSGSSLRICLENGTWSTNVPICKPIKCGIPEAIMMGDVHVTSLLFKARSNYTCRTGHKITGSLFTECQANATWSTVNTACEPIVCPKLPNIPHGYVKWTSLQYGASAAYNCFPGYEIAGNSVRICEHSDTWSNNEPICVLRECSKPLKLQHGWVEAERFTVGSTISYYCNNGFELEGPPTRTCLQNGSWSVVIPNCKKISCMHPLDIPNGNAIGKEYSFESVVKYTCEEGYRLIGSSELKCSANKMWSKDLPNCEPLPCQRPSPPSFGTVFFRTLAVGSVVHYSCKEGYELVGSTNSTCLSDQTWTTGAPYCRILTCPEPQLPKNSKSTLNGFVNTSGFYMYGSVLRFECLSKYKVLGPETITCTAKGNWSKTFPKCQRYLCEDPPIVNNSHCISGPYVIGQLLNYSCDVGYYPGENNTLLCDKAGYWIGAAPVCKPVDCGQPSALQHAVLFLTDGHTLGARAQYKCINGYVLKGGPSVCGTDGNWTSEPQCEEVTCENPLPVNYSTYVVTRKPGLTQVVYTCIKGYKLLGMSKHICNRTSRSWNITGTSCTMVNCGHPPTIAFGGITGFPILTFGSRIGYHCFPGYRIVGNIYIECSWKGIWEGKPPHCVPITCPPLNAPSHGIVKGEDFYYESSVVYSCNKGYQIFGRSTRFCLEDGSWSGEQPFCQRKACEIVKMPENSFLLEDVNEQYGDILRIACYEGFALIGNAALKCLDSGKWNYELPVCEAVTCPLPTILPTGTALMDIKKKFTIGNKISFVCELGFRQYGDLTVHCLSNGSWSRPSGLCKKVSCGRPKMSNGAIVLGMSYLYRDNLVVVCPPGTRTKGKTILSCKDNGEWDNKPKCEGMCQRPCLNGGVCVPPGLCSCPSGYVGDICQHAVCILPCLNGGTCIGPYNCLCLPGYSGSRCQLSNIRRLYRG